MMIDLDRFKPVNDVFGHSVGDQVLIAFAKRATAVARRTTRRLAARSSSGVRAAQWGAWNAAIDSAVAIADQISREPAASFADLGIKIEALHWWCVEFDAFSDLGGTGVPLQRSRTASPGDALA